MPAQPYGRFLLNQSLPDEHRITGPITKKELKERMNVLARTDPARYARSITRLKRQGDRLSTLEGLSIGLDDITPDYKERNRRMAPLRRKFQNATTDAARRQIAGEAQKELLDIVDKHQGSLTLQVKSGARGNPAQYAKMVSGLGYARTPGGKAVPWLIEQSYSEGLSPANHWATTGESMMDVIKTYTAISEPGELSKKLVAGMADAVVTIMDCGTHNGIPARTTSPDAIDRYLARDAGPFKKGTLVTPNNQSQLAKVSSRIMVRSPMTCEAADGVCQKCQGLDEKGNLHSPGINVGVRAAQAMSEPLTQFALNAKHGGRTLESDKSQVHGIAGFRQIIETPRQFVNQATLAAKDGQISRIAKAPQGGHFVHIGETKHYVTPELRVTVEKGDKVAAGDTLSEGIPKPDEVVHHKGINAGRLYMVKTLKNLYKGQGKDLDSRHFELLAKSGLNHVRIMEDPSGAFIKGDIVGYNALRADLSKRVKLVKLTDAVGETLGKEYTPYSVGMRVTPQMVRDLKSQGVPEVFIAPRAPSVEFVMKSATNVPKMHPDWMARMAHQGLKATVLQAAQKGEISQLHGTHPVPAYAYGVEFGQGPEGRY